MRKPRPRATQIVKTTLRAPISTKVMKIQHILKRNFPNQTQQSKAHMCTHNTHAHPNNAKMKNKQCLTTNAQNQDNANKIMTNCDEQPKTQMCTKNAFAQPNRAK